MKIIFIHVSIDKLFVWMLAILTATRYIREAFRNRARYRYRLIRQIITFSRFGLNQGRVYDDLWCYTEFVHGYEWANAFMFPVNIPFNLFLIKIFNDLKMITLASVWSSVDYKLLN